MLHLFMPARFVARSIVASLQKNTAQCGNPIYSTVSGDIFVSVTVSRVSGEIRGGCSLTLEVSRCFVYTH